MRTKSSRRCPGVGLVVQSRHGITEAPEVDRVSGRFADAPVHPAQYRADPRQAGRDCLDNRGAVQSRQRLRDGQIAVHSEYPKPSQLGADGRRGIHGSAVPVRPVHPDQVLTRRAGVPERGVLSVGEERESSLRQRVAAERGQRHPAEPGCQRARGRHPAT